MDTKPGAAPGARRRRRHSAEFKAMVVEECRRSGVSIAAVALANGLNANLLRRWVVQAGVAAGTEPPPKAAPPTDQFIALPLVAATPPAAPAEIRIELRRGATAITICWPAQAAGDCAAWLRDWLR